MKVIKLGRLQFEVLENIDDLSNVFEETKDFLFVNVHIREGEKLTPEECEKSYDMAVNFYKSGRLTLSYMTVTKIQRI